MPARTAIVIGTGVAGAGTAFALARRGIAVTMVEADLVGSATAAGAGIIQPWSSSVDGEFYRLYAAGADYYDELIGQLAATGVHDIGYRRAGALVVNQDSELLDAVEARVASRASDARAMGEVSRISNERARELFPPLGPGFRALHIEGGARVDGRSLRAGLLAGAQTLGAVVLPGTASVVGTDSGDWAVRLDGADGRELTADILVIAAGAWTNQVLEPLGRRIPIEPQRGQITHLRVGTADTTYWPSVHPIASHYMVAFDDSRVVVGATREFGSGFDPRVTAAGQRQVLDNALSVAPGLADATLIETRVGLRPLPDGELPSVGPLEGMPGVYLNAGFGAAGLTMGPFIGELLATLIADETTAPSTGFLSPIA
ncbi:NAD(P)/FAD-dependent oxidoreductase [Leifsonia sp. NPDC058230]|uniref:NAD(P)/FAD-dependent oxidoreductase n=1 Tax=Leifsonia sp. NPDC058230 TaxID=3346391 RepID=UPI0036DE4142